MRAVPVTVCLLLSTAVVRVEVFAQYEGPGWSSFGAGFGTSQSGQSGVVASVGEPVLGTVTGTNTIVRNGFLVNQDLLHAVTSVRGAGWPASPEGFALFQNFPNPFNPSTTIAFFLPEESRIRVRIFSILGEQVAMLVDEVHAAGYVEQVWSGSTGNSAMAGSGVYFYVLEATGLHSRTSYRDVKRMVLLK
jgi:hypothetical protein